MRPCEPMEGGPADCKGCKGFELCHRKVSWLGCQQDSFSYILPRSGVVSQRAFLQPFRYHSSMGPQWVKFLDYIYLSPRTHRTSGDFNPGVQPRGTPITAKVVHGGIMDINVMWRDAQGCVIVGSWSRSSGWNLANPNDGKAHLDGQDWGHYYGIAYKYPFTSISFA